MKQTRTMLTCGGFDWLDQAVQQTVHRPAGHRQHLQRNCCKTHPTPLEGESLSDMPFPQPAVPIAQPHKHHARHPRTRTTSRICACLTIKRTGGWDRWVLLG